MWSLFHAPAQGNLKFSTKPLISALRSASVPGKRTYWLYSVPTKILQILLTNSLMEGTDKSNKAANTLKLHPAADQ